ncbi:hypothetical protein EVAR_35632_1 [Eumeta japonica]|uniref:Uncharacterized protein n=1 Tax=Eumeta variegata TaxID=151549 RepID=A0A4C1WDM1_EUMVA|nr:hypothetical protein EVAR_35632_1 [Eumeta japonica]
MGIPLGRFYNLHRSRDAVMTCDEPQVRAVSSGVHHKDSFERWPWSWSRTRTVSGRSSELLASDTNASSG